MSTAFGDHACSTHRFYGLTCDDYDAIQVRFSGACWRCRNLMGNQIDHDHEGGMTAVRGWVCGPCNHRLALVDRDAAVMNDVDAAYLVGAWHHARDTTFTPDARTALRNLRVDEKLWAEAKRIADERRETLSAVMKRALVEYVEKHGGSVEW